MSFVLDSAHTASAYRQYFTDIKLIRGMVSFGLVIKFNLVSSKII